jgi:hypothetical protein
MSHPDPEDLAIGALEGLSNDEVRWHVEQCPQCRDEVESLRHVVEAGRAGGRRETVVHERPSEAVWDRIASDLGLPTPNPVPVASPIDRTDRRWWQRTTAWVAAAALVVGALATVAIQRFVTGNSSTVVASAELEPLPGWDAAGTADVREADGDRVLVVDLAAAPDQGFREVWLISLDLQRLVSLGVLTGSEGSFDVPDGLDLDDFAIVDVSAEPLDGDPAHSGDSIVRGELA